MRFTAGATTGMNGTVAGSHVYADNGIFTVTVTVTDDDGASTSSTLTITVGNVAPTVNAGPNQVTVEGTAISLAPATFNDNPLTLTVPVPPRRSAARRSPMLVFCTDVVVRARFPRTVYVFKPATAAVVASLTMNVTDAVAPPAPAIEALTVTDPAAGPSASVI